MTTDNSPLAEEIRLAMTSDERLKERVKVLVMRWVAQRQVDPQALREVTQAVLEGVGTGLTERGLVATEALGEAVRGLDEALSRTVYAMQMAMEESWGEGQRFAAEDVKPSLDELRALEGDLLQSLRATAGKSQGWIGQALGALGDHLAHNGTDTGQRVREVTETLGNRLRATASGAGGAVLSDAEVLRTRLAAVTSGVLRGLADALDTQH